MLLMKEVSITPVTTVRTEIWRGASSRRRVESSMWRAALEALYMPVKLGSVRVAVFTMNSTYNCVGVRIKET